MTQPRPDIARLVFSVLVICGLMVASLWVLAPFAAAIVWATTIVVATWPLLLALQKRLRGKRGLAVAVLTVTLLAVVFLPFLGAVGALVGSADEIATKVKSLSTAQVPPPPAWIASVPFVGAKATAYWQTHTGEGLKEVSAKVAPYANAVLKWFVASAGSIGSSLAHFLLTVVVAAVFWANGEEAARRVVLFARRMAGDRGEAVVRLAGNAVRGVALGVVVTAVGQSILGGIGLAIAGVPFASVLTVVMFILCIAQVGPILVLLPSVVWLYGTDHPGWGTFLLVWTVIVGTADNFVRPVLIKKGADLPLLLIFAGVIGGLVTLGLIGIFVGPVILAVSHTLLEAWIEEGDGLGAAESEAA